MSACAGHINKTVLRRASCCWGVMLVSNAKRKVDRKAAPADQASEPEGAVGNALRSVYAKAVGEDIPQEMLDLLGKLK